MNTSFATTAKHQGYLDEHERLAHLFATDRFAFELERKRILNKAIDEMSTRKRRREQQKEWDQLMSGIGSQENRFAMAQALFYHYMVNNWQPGLREYSKDLNTLVNGKYSKPALCLVE